MKNLYDKLAARGAASLTDKELLTLLTDDELTAEALLKASGGSLVRLGSAELARLRMMGGLGLRRARLLVAAAEFGRRAAAMQVQEAETLSNTEDVVRYFRPRLEKLDHEECWAVYLTSSNRILESWRISQGGVQATIVDHRIIMLATRLVLIHNHPSGSAEVSDDDKLLTKRILRAAGFFDIRVLDHIIIAREGYFSFRQSKML